MNYKQNFKRHKLPDPREYFQIAGFDLKGPGEWKTTHCPFHKDSKPSLSVNIQSGGFKCFSCGESGGDVLAFHMKHKNLNFIDAAKHLGAWEVAK